MPPEPAPLLLLPADQALSLLSQRQDAVPAQDALELEPEPLSGPDRGLVAVVGEPLNSAELEVVEQPPEEECGRVGRYVRAVEGWERQDMPVGRGGDGEG